MRMKVVASSVLAVALAAAGLLGYQKYVESERLSAYRADCRAVSDEPVIAISTLEKLPGGLLDDGRSAAVSRVQNALRDYSKFMQANSDISYAANFEADLNRAQISFDRYLSFSDRYMKAQANPWAVLEMRLLGQIASQRFVGTDRLEAAMDQAAKKSSKWIEDALGMTYAQADAELQGLLGKFRTEVASMTVAHCPY